MLNKARIIKAASAEPIAAGASAPGSARVVARSEVQANEAAERIRARARTEAEQIRSAARSDAESAAQQAHAAGLARGLAEAAARCLHLAKLQADADAAALERQIELARLLAERLLGKALELEPELVGALAKQVLSEVRGAARIALYVSPDDLPSLRQQLEQLGVGEAALKLDADPELGRGDFRLVTNVGSLDATLGSRLELLSQKLRESLQS